MDKKKVVIISRTLLPSQAPRSHRTTELAKEFSRQGYDVTVFAVLGNYNYSNFEKSHNIKVKNLGPTKFALQNSDGFVPKMNRNIFKHSTSILLRKLFEYPDIELALKVKNVLRNQEDIDLLITVAVPYPIHWGVAYAKNKMKNFPKTWVADCGDPYMGNKLTRRLFYFKYVEKWFCRAADYITIPIEAAKEGYYKEFHHKIKVIPQGFSFDEFTHEEVFVKNPIPTFVYAGNFYPGVRDPRPFLDYLTTLDLDFKFIIYTRSNALLAKYKNQLKDKLEIKDYIPRLELLKILSKADFLVNFENNTSVQSPSKLIDYAMTHRPILSVESFNLNHDEINAFLNGDYSSQYSVSNLEQYNIKNIVKQFIKLKN